MGIRLRALLKQHLTHWMIVTDSLAQGSRTGWPRCAVMHVLGCYPCACIHDLSQLRRSGTQTRHPCRRVGLAPWHISHSPGGLLGVFFAAALTTQSNVPSKAKASRDRTSLAYRRACASNVLLLAHSSLYSAICCSSFSISALSSLLYLKREKLVSLSGRGVLQVAQAQLTRS